MKKEELVFIPLGGVGEIGMNMALYGYGNKHKKNWIMVDCGISFPDPGEMPGVEVIVPDIRFIEDELHALKAIFITHPHEDHIGALVSLYPRLRAPVYMSNFAYNLLCAKNMNLHKNNNFKINLIEPTQSYQIGDVTIDPIAVSHSVPEAMAFAIKTPLGTILHTGDWKFDEDPVLGHKTNSEALEKLGQEGVDVLVCDSTNALRDGESPTEGEVGVNLTKAIAQAEQRVAVTLFSSNVARIESVLKAAEANGRQVVVAGRALHRVIEAAKESGFLKNLPPVLDQDSFKQLPRKKTLLLLTGSQGESRAALARIAYENHPFVDLAKGDTLIFSSRIIPGNERSVLNISNRLVTKGVKIITADDATIHVSGHPRRGELRRLYQLTKPKSLVPVHGEPIHLHAHKNLAAEEGITQCAIIKDGDVLRLLPEKLEVIDEVPSGFLVRDGSMLTDPEETGVFHRKKLSMSGIIVVHLIVDERRELITDPELVIDGLPSRDYEGEEIDAILYDHILDVIEGLPKAKRKDLKTLEKSVQRSARSKIFEIWGKKPICHVTISTVEDYDE